MRNVQERAASARAQVPLMLVAFACAVGLLLAVARGAGIDTPIAVALAALFLANGLLRLWLRGRR